MFRSYKRSDTIPYRNLTKQLVPLSEWIGRFSQHHTCTIVQLQISIILGDFKGLTFPVFIYATRKYPIQPPFAYSGKPLRHPNFNAYTNKIALNIQQTWSPLNDLPQFVMELVSTISVPNLGCVPNNTANQTMALDYINRNESSKFYQGQSPMAISGMQIQDQEEEPEGQWEATQRICDMSFKKRLKEPSRTHSAIDSIILDMSRVRIWTNE